MATIARSNLIRTIINETGDSLFPSTTTKTIRWILSLFRSKLLFNDINVSEYYHSFQYIPADSEYNINIIETIHKMVCITRRRSLSSIKNKIKYTLHISLRSTAFEGWYFIVLYGACEIRKKYTRIVFCLWFCIKFAWINFLGS